MSLENKVKLQFNRESQAWISWVASSVDHLRSIYEPLKQFKKKFFFFLPHLLPCVIFLPQPGVKPAAPALERQSKPLDCQGSPYDPFTWD